MKKPFYGWVVCGLGTLLLFVTMGTVSNGFSIYLPYIMEECGLTNAQTSSLVTLRCLAAFFSMLAVGVYYKKVRFRLGTALAAGLAGLSFLCYSMADSYPAFCVGAAISGMSYGLGSMIPVSILINRWFVSHKALALSICATGSGLATIILPPVTAALVEQMSMRAAFRIEVVFIFLVVALLALFLREDPADLGLTPLGQGELPQTENGTPAPPVSSYTLTKKMWLMLGCVSLFMGAVSNPGFSHLSVHFTTAGLDPMLVAVLISVIGAMITVGKLLYGQITDKIGGCKSSLLFGAVLLVGHLLCCLAFLQNTALCAVAAVLVGIGYAISTIGPSVWANDMASRDHYPTVLRRLQITYAGGSLAFASVPGILADRFHGTYVPAYLLLSVMLTLALSFIALSYREQRLRER